MKGLMFLATWGYIYFLFGRRQSPLSVFFSLVFLPKNVLLEASFQFWFFIVACLKEVFGYVQRQNIIHIHRNIYNLCNIYHNIPNK